MIKNDYIQIEYLADVNAVHTDWLTTPTSQEFRKGMEQIIEAIRKYKTGKLVTDTTNLGAIDPSDQEWTLTEWTPIALEAGYKCIAIIISSDIFAQLSVEDIMSNVKGVQQMKYFDSFAQATQWISAQ